MHVGRKHDMTMSRVERVSRAGAVALLAATVALTLGTGTAAAAPPGFPDLDAFTPVEANQYAASAGKTSVAVKFSTPDGLECGLANYGPDSPETQNYAWCSGGIPGMPADAESVHGEADKVTGYGGPVFMYKFVKNGGFKPGPQKILDVGQKISSANITCVIGADRLAACINRVDNHGFVLQPSGSWTF